MRSKELAIEYNWAEYKGPHIPMRPRASRVEIDDETLRDGLQGTQLELHPTTDIKKSYLHAMRKYGHVIDHADIGFPGPLNEPNQTRHQRELRDIIKFVVDKRLGITLSVAARGPVEKEMRSILDISHKLDGYPIEADLFFDPTESRAELEQWDRKEMLGKLTENIKLLKRHNLPVMFVAERSTASTPQQLFEVFERAADLGVDRLCIADTQGLVSPAGVSNIFRWAFMEFGLRYPDIKWDAHFHNHRGTAQANCLVAVDEGVERLHATAFCIGEAAGNVDIFQLWQNLNLEGVRDEDRRGLVALTQYVSELLSAPIAGNTPIYGDKVHKTSSGVHASAANKEALSDRPHSIYFAYDPEEIGAKVGVEIGPFSGLANVQFKLRELGIEYTDEMAREILKEAKSGRGLLNPATIKGIATRFLNGNK